MAADPFGPITDSYYIPATVRDVKKLDAKVAREFHLNEVKTVVGILISGIGVTFAVFFMLEARSQTKVDAGVAPVVERVTKAEGRIEKVENVVQENALRTARIETMVELVLKDQRIKPPPPVVYVPPPKDGGT